MSGAIKKMAPATAILALLYYSDEIIFGLPIVATTAIIGALPAFIIFSVLYFLFDYWLGMVMLKIVRGDLVIKNIKNPVLRKITSWIKSWFDSIEQSGLVAKLKNKLSTKKGNHVRYSGFILVSYFGSAFITIPVMYVLGQRKHLRLLTAISASIYALTFVAKWALGTFIFLELIKFIINLF